MFFIEGNIGAGKSTFLSLLTHWCPFLEIVQEPLDRWDGDGASSLLGNFVQDPQRWGLTLETYTMMCRLRELVTMQKNDFGNLIAERSVYSGYYVFARNSYEQGFLNDLEWAVCRDVFARCVGSDLVQPQGFIYLRVSPETAYRRVKMRNRASESGLSIAYLEQIHRQHERFLVERDGIGSDVSDTPVLIVDYDQDFDFSSAKGLEVAKLVAEFVSQQTKKSVDTLGCRFNDRVA